MEMRGVEHVRDLRSNVILAANHPHEIDPLVLVAALPFAARHVPLIFVAKERKQYRHTGWRRYIYGGFFFKLLGALPASVGVCDYEKALHYHIAALQKGYSVCIFPMGRRHLTGDIEQAKGGVSFLTAHSGLPILPVRIIGLERMSYADFFLRRRKAVIVFGPPLYFTDISEARESNPNWTECERAAVRLMRKIMSL